jgi:hypothetical protein
MADAWNERILAIVVRAHTSGYEVGRDRHDEECRRREQYAT